MTKEGGENSNIPRFLKSRSITRVTKNPAEAENIVRPDAWNALPKPKTPLNSSETFSTQQDIHEAVNALSKLAQGIYISFESVRFTTIELFEFQSILEDVLTLKLSSAEKSAAAALHVSVRACAENEIAVFRVGSWDVGQWKPYSFEDLPILATTSEALANLIRRTTIGSESEL